MDNTLDILSSCLLLITDCSSALHFLYLSNNNSTDPIYFVMFNYPLPFHKCVFLLFCFLSRNIPFQVSLQKQALDKEVDTLKEKLKWTEGQLQQSQKKEAQTQAKLTVIH